MVDGVFEGGGVLGAAFAGSLRLLEDNRIWFARVAGTSAGAITAAMVAAGYTAEEIQWLCSPAGTGGQRPSVIPPERGPIDFSEFLDFPSFDQVSEKARRSSLLWNYLKGALLDRVMEMQLPLPERARLAADIVKKALDVGVDVPSIPRPKRVTAGDMLGKMPVIGDDIDSHLEEAVGKVLAAAHYPEKPQRVGAFLPLTNGMAGLTEEFRTRFADEVWKAIVGVVPAELVATQLLYEGSLFEGDKFLGTIEELLQVARRRERPDRSGPVTFADLKIPLAVIATDVEAGGMVVYSSGQERDRSMSVAEAVRRSMSIPFVFQAREGRFVDGGLCSNFPAWLLTRGADEYWPASARDGGEPRPKVGLVLDDNRGAPAGWRVAPPAHAPRGSPPRVDGWPVLKPILVRKLRELHVRVFTGEAMGEELRRKVFNACGAYLDRIALLRGIDRVAGRHDKENVSRPGIVRALMAGQPYYDVVLPLLGYHWLDFELNAKAENKEKLAAMWDRAWRATAVALSTPEGRDASTAVQPLLARPVDPEASPFKET